MDKVSFAGETTPYKIGKVLCIGRNYAKHAAEMGGEAPEQPWVFLKPSSALIPSGGQVILPHQSSDVHHEVELVALIGRTVRNISPDAALDCVDGYAVGLDMTARDLQAVAKKSGRPWSVAKGFDTFAPLGAFAPAGEISDPQSLQIELRVDGEIRQSGYTGDMIFSVAELISFCSTIFTLERGDLLYTGTPEGVGPVVDGNELVAEISGLPVLEVRVSRS